jgi:DDE superfamily endonuclease
MNKKYIVSLSSAERKELEALVSRGKQAAWRQLRAWILLQADSGPHGPAWTDARIVEAYGVSAVTVYRVREALGRMEQILDVYKRPYDKRFPVVCMDETSKQLVGEVRQPLKARPGQVNRIDNEYERKGTCNLFMFFEPLRGWRHVWVTDQRRKIEWAYCVRKLLDVYYAEAEKITLVSDNLNTHTGGALYEAFPAREAKRLCDRLEFEPTPKHGSWLNMAETELSVMAGQCLDRRIDNKELVTSEVSSWNEERNRLEAKVRWQFTMEDARIKLERLYPVIEMPESKG